MGKLTPTLGKENKFPEKWLSGSGNKNTLPFKNRSFAGNQTTTPKLEISPVLFRK